MDDLQAWTMNSLSLAKGMTAENVVTASMPGVGTSVYYLNKNEVFKLQCIINAMKEEHNLENFSFEVDNLYGNDIVFKEGKNTVYYDGAL